MEETYSFREKIKNTSIKLAISYVVLGSLWMSPENVTGHYSADLNLGKRQLTQFEESIYNPIFNKLGIESRLLKE